MTIPDDSASSILTGDQVLEVQDQFGTPVFVYDQLGLERRASEALAFPNPFGLTARYAMKACPNAAVIRVLTNAGLHIDASSAFEARRAIAAGVDPSHILLTAQELDPNFATLVQEGVRFNACSLQQLRAFGEAFPGAEVGVRFNPGLGSGHSRRTNVGGPSASFGVWYDHVERVLEMQRQYDLQITLLHSHIGSGSDPQVWQRCAGLTLAIVERFPSVTTVNLGGGYKVARVAGEDATDLVLAGTPVASALEEFAQRCGRQLRLEIEPGTFLVANAGAIVSTVIDVVDTGKEGFSFIKVDAGMTEILRPSLYGAQHPIDVVRRAGGAGRTDEFLVVGHCCESGDVLTPEPGNPEGLLPRELTVPEIGDAIVIGGSGAYCSAMAAKNYNSFPEAPEVLLDRDGSFHLIRARQSLGQVLQNEALPDYLKSP